MATFCTSTEVVAALAPFACRRCGNHLADANPHKLVIAGVELTTRGRERVKVRCPKCKTARVWCPERAVPGA